MLTLEHLTAGYGKETVLRDLSFAFSTGSTTGIVGASGIGKSTLLHVIAGLLRPSEGLVRSSHQRISYIFQDPRLFPWMTALENITAVGADREAARQYLRLLFDDADEVAKKYPYELSGGMKQRISVARALAYAPDLLLLDEPFRGLDADTKEKVAELLFQKNTVRTLLLVTHDEADLRYCDEIVRMDGSPVSRLLLEKSGNAEIE